MKSIIHIIIASIVLVALISLPANAVTSDHYYIHYTHMTMKFSGTDAIVTLSFELDTFAKVYTLLMGTHNLEEDIKEMFYEFEDVKVSQIHKEYAIVRISNVSRLSNGYYLHDSRKLGSGVDLLTIVFPSGATKQISNANATMNIFY
ncbi:MAG: hypothetical protein H5T43_08430 [Methanomethylovorans sp.]|jgi:hypothetical protein|nr:hypothetical protein [Methanomethylovorans sp.]